jgi:hypothetical protein
MKKPLNVASVEFVTKTTAPAWAPFALEVVTVTVLSDRERVVTVD